MYLNKRVCVCVASKIDFRNIKPINLQFTYIFIYGDTKSSRENFYFPYKKFKSNKTNNDIDKFEECVRVRKISMGKYVSQAAGAMCQSSKFHHITVFAYAFPKHKHLHTQTHITIMQQQQQRWKINHSKHSIMWHCTFSATFLNGKRIFAFPTLTAPMPMECDCIISTHKTFLGTRLPYFYTKRWGCDSKLHYFHLVSVVQFR